MKKLSKTLLIAFVVSLGVIACADHAEDIRPIGVECFEGCEEPEAVKNTEGEDEWETDSTKVN